MNLPHLPRKPRREEVADQNNLCDHCTAKCCKYFALPLEKPTCRKDFDYLRWFLLHDRAAVFVEEGVWYILIYTSCKHLQSDNRCGIYHTRPEICREYTTDKCEYEDDWVYEKYFETSEQVEEYADAVLKRPRGESLRGPRPALLPLL